MQSKEKLVASLRSYAATMKELVIEANIKPSQIEIPLETERLSFTELEEGVEWLQKVFEKQFKECREVKELLPKEQWEHYRQMDMTGTIEMRELKERLRGLRKAIINKNRPKIFRRNHVSKKANQSEEKQQEQSTGESPGG